MTIYIAVDEVIDSPSGDQGLILDGGDSMFSNICPINNVRTKADQTRIYK